MHGHARSRHSLSNKISSGQSCGAGSNERAHESRRPIVLRVGVRAARPSERNGLLVSFLRSRYTFPPRILLHPGCIGFLEAT